MTDGSRGVAPTCRVVFAPSGLSVTVPEGTTVLDAARTAGADLDSTCGGRGICGRCQVVPASGSFPKWRIESTVESVTPWTSTEEEYTGRRPIVGDQRLGCAMNVHGDVVVEIPAASQVHRQIVRKSVDIVGELEVDPVVKLHYVVLPTDTDDLQHALAEQLAADFDITMTDLSPRAAADLPDAVSGGSGHVTVAVRSGGAVTAVFAGYHDRALGIAVDIGSTTVAGHLVDLGTGEVLASSGMMNPQIRFGDDLMSRVSYVMMNPGGDAQLTAAIRRALDEMIVDLTGDVDAAPAEVLEITLVGNPVMHHVVLGLDPTPLGQAPFPLATDGAVHTTAPELELDAPNASVYLLPNIAGHVGADTAAAVLSEGPHRDDDLQLLVDVGTNAEIVFGNTNRLLAASSPTGPAFEGAQISAGMRATAGAIERVRIDSETLEPRVRVIGCDLWSDEPGFAEATRRLDIAGICGSGIIEVMGELYLSGLLDVDGTLRADGAERTDRVFAQGRTFSYRLYGDADDPAANVNVTQEDVRAIQLAKAALRAGIDLLCEHAGTDDPATIGSVRLAGAFGAHIDPLYAKILGLVPDVPVDRVRSVGNAAGAGAVRALLSASQRAEIEETVGSIEKIETATEARFQELFVAAMGFPHSEVPTPHLATETRLPPRRERENGGASGRRRTRRRSVIWNDSA